MISDSMSLVESFTSGMLGTLTLTEQKLIFSGRGGKTIFTRGPVENIEIYLQDILSIRKEKVAGALSPKGMIINSTKGSIYKFANEYKQLRGRVYSIDQWIGFIEAAIAELKEPQTTTTDNKTESATLPNDQYPIFCHKCGKKAESGDIYCAGCGTKLLK